MSTVPDDNKQYPLQIKATFFVIKEIRAFFIVYFDSLNSKNKVKDLYILNNVYINSKFEYRTYDVTNNIGPYSFLAEYSRVKSFFFSTLSKRVIDLGTDKQINILDVIILRKILHK